MSFFMKGSEKLNQRIEKLRTELEKTKERIARNQTRQRELERQLLEAENADIIAAVRSMEVPPEDLAAMIELLRNQPISQLDPKKEGEQFEN